MKTDAQKRANLKFEAKAYDRLNLRIRKDSTMTRNDIQKAADAAGESLNGYILKAIDMRMKTEL
jgi:uncharacterized protein (DUF1778 family)